MAKTVGAVLVKLSASTSKFDSSMRRSGKQVSGFAAKVGSANKVLGALGVGLSAAAAIGGMKKMLSMAQESIDAENKLGAVLKTTGGAAGHSAGELQAYAADLQKVTNFEDDATVNAMAMLATFKNIRGDTFKEATKAAMDMSAVLGTDLKTTVMQVGKALNDPTKGMTTLSRAGVSFTAQQKEQVKTLQASGDLLGAQTIILAELKSEFGGAAEAMANPITQMKNALGDLGESIGKAALPYMKMLADEVKSGAEGLTDMSTKASALESTFGDIADLVWYTAKGFQGLQGLILEFVATVVELPGKLNTLGAAKGPHMSDEDIRRSYAGMGLDINDEQLEEVKKSLGISHEKSPLEEVAISLRESAKAYWKKWFDDVLNGKLPSERAAEEKNRPKLPPRTPKPPTEDLDAKVDAELKADRQKAWESLRPLLEAQARMRRDAERIVEANRAPLEKFNTRLFDVEKLVRVGALDRKMAQREVLGMRADLFREMGIDTTKDQQPAEKFDETVTKIGDLVQKGLMTMDEAHNAVANAANEFGQSQQTPLPGVAEYGSQEAYAAIVRAMTGAEDPALRLAQRGNEHLNRIANATNQMATKLDFRVVELK